MQEGSVSGSIHPSIPDWRHKRVSFIGIVGNDAEESQVRKKRKQNFLLTHIHTYNIHLLSDPISFPRLNQNKSAHPSPAYANSGHSYVEPSHARTGFVICGPTSFSGQNGPTLHRLVTKIIYFESEIGEMIFLETGNRKQQLNLAIILFSESECSIFDTDKTEFNRLCRWTGLSGWSGVIDHLSRNRSKGQIISMNYMRQNDENFRRRRVQHFEFHWKLNASHTSAAPTQELVHVFICEPLRPCGFVGSESYLEQRRRPITLH